MLYFQVERLFPNVFPELGPLLERNWRETGEEDGCGPCVPDEELYRTLEQNECLCLVTARDRSGRLAGYAAYIVAPSAHYKGVPMAEADVFYLEPESRKGLAGLQLLRFAEQELARRGVRLIQQRVKVSHDCGALLRRMGYRQAETLYVRNI